MSRELDAIARAGAAEAEEELTDPQAIQETEARRETYVQLKDFMKEFKGIARAIFRKDHDTLQYLRLTD